MKSLRLSGCYVVLIQCDLIGQGLGVWRGIWQSTDARLVPGRDLSGFSLTKIDMLIVKGLQSENGQVSDAL